MDRVLSVLLGMGFRDLVRIGSVKKIAKDILPYRYVGVCVCPQWYSWLFAHRAHIGLLRSVHTSTKSQDLKDLKDMLKANDLSPDETRSIKEAIQALQKDRNKERLAKVLAGLCASCPLCSAFMEVSCACRWCWLGSRVRLARLRALMPTASRYVQGQARYALAACVQWGVRPL